MQVTEAYARAAGRVLAAAVLFAAVSSVAGGPCLIISEVVDGGESGGCPNWIEIANTGLTDFTFDEGGVIVQMDGSNDVIVDVDLSGVTIVAGQSYVIVSNAEGCTGAFFAVYGMDADLYTQAQFGDGDDRYILTDTRSGTNLLDIYGEFGVDGTGAAWEYTRGFSYRLPAYNAGNSGDFAAEEWHFGGVDSLVGEDPTWLLLENTTPKVHEYDVDCVPGDLDGNGCVNHSDLGILLADWNCTGGDCPGDCDGDGDTDHADLGILLANWGAGCP